VLTSSRPADVAATSISAACVAHCLLLPILASLLPAFGTAAEAEWVHSILAAIAIPVSIIALHRIDAAPLTALAIRTAAAIGLGLLVVAALGWLESIGETTLTLLGACLLASAHVVNFMNTHRKIIEL